MDVLVSGASGFIGRHLMSLVESDINFFPFKRGSDKSGIEQIEGVKPSAFVHLAAVSSNAECEADVGRAFEANVAYACQVYEEYSRECPNGHFIFFSTGQVYDFNTNEVIVESSRLAPQSLYAETKLCAEVALQSMAQFRSAKMTIVRLFNTSHKSQDSRFFLSSIYQQMIATSGESVELVVGNIDIKRDFSTVHDTSEKILKLIRGQLGEVKVINFCSGNTYSLRELAVAMGRSLGKNVTFRIDPSRVRSEDAPVVKAGSLIIKGCEISVEDFLRKWGVGNQLGSADSR